jgi:hypothetical protein
MKRGHEHGARTWPAAVVAGLGLVLGLASGCTGTTGHLAMATTRTIDPATFDFDSRTARHVVGRSCTDVVVVFPFRIPSFGDAIDDALRQTGGSVLTSVVIGYEVLDIPLVYGRACYVVEGDTW